MNDSYLIGSYFLLFYLAQATILPLAILFPSFFTIGAFFFIMLARYRIDRNAQISHAWFWHPVATVLYVVLLATAMIRRLKKREISWKGRTYS